MIANSTFHVLNFLPSPASASKSLYLLTCMLFGASWFRMAFLTKWFWNITSIFDIASVFLSKRMASSLTTRRDMLPRESNSRLLSLMFRSKISFISLLRSRTDFPSMSITALSFYSTTWIFLIITDTLLPIFSKKTSRGVTSVDLTLQLTDKFTLRIFKSCDSEKIDTSSSNVRNSECEVHISVVFCQLSEIKLH